VADCAENHPCADMSVQLPADQICPAFATEGKLSASTAGYSADALRKLARTDSRCRIGHSGAMFGPLVAGDANVLRNLVGVTDPAAVQALAQGKVLVQDARYVKNGRATISVEIMSDAGDGSAAPVTRKITVPAFALDDPVDSLIGLMSPETARGLGLTLTPAGSVWLPSQSTTSAQQQRADAAVSALAPGSVQVERGYQATDSAIAIGLAVAAAVVAVAAAGITTGLASADSQADLATLAAVGAAPRIRRSLSGFQCAVIAAMGALLGAVAGLVPAAALWWSQTPGEQSSYDAVTGMIQLWQHGPLVVPWPSMALIVLGLPLLAWLLAAGLTRSRVVLTRRTG